MEQKKPRIWGRVIALLSIVLAVFVGGYFFLDLAIIPKYFGQYGIKNVPDLVGVVTSLYKSPNEKKLIKNPYTSQDLTSAINTLQQANYKIASDGTVTEVDFKGDATVVLTDREVAALCNQLIDNGILMDALPGLNYLNMINISVLEVLITPDKNSKDGDHYSKANLEFIAKLETNDIREQIAEHMDTPLFLLNMIIPDNLYFMVSYDLDLSKAENERVSNETIAINGRTAEQSEILMNLLIDFIFPAEDNMNLEKFTHTFGDIILQGIDVFGDFKFTFKGNQAGIYVDPLTA
jgi:hypothetical protein